MKNGPAAWSLIFAMQRPKLEIEAADADETVITTGAASDP
jgi:hypothetical protein